MGHITSLVFNVGCLQYVDMKPRIFGPVARQPALPWQPVCTQKVVGGLKCYHRSMKWIEWVSRVQRPTRHNIGHFGGGESPITELTHIQAQIPLGSSRHVSTRLDTIDVSSESRRACRAVLFQHGGRRTRYSARLYKFSRFYAFIYTNPICSVK